MLTNMRIRIAQIRMVLWDCLNEKPAGQEDLPHSMGPLDVVAKAKSLEKLPTVQAGFGATSRGCPYATPRCSAQTISPSLIRTTTRADARSARGTLASTNRSDSFRL